MHGSILLRDSRQRSGSNEALAAYTKRSRWETIRPRYGSAHYRMGRLCDIAGNWPGAQLHYLDAYQHITAPCRAAVLARAWRTPIASRTRSLCSIWNVRLCWKNPPSDLFVEEPVYHHMAHMQYAICLHNVGEHEEARLMARELLKEDRVPAEQRPVIEAIAGTEKEAVHRLTDLTNFINAYLGVADTGDTPENKGQCVGLS